MIEALHASAVAPAALGACCVAADRGRPREADLVASLLMVVAMLDAAVTHLVPVVWWACLLVAAALVHAVTTRARRGDPPARHSAGAARGTAMRVHAGIGLIVMAALLLLMTASPEAAAAVAPNAHHGGGSGDAVVAMLASGYGVASAWLARRGPLVERLQFAAMGASAVLMGLAALV